MSFFSRLHGRLRAGTSVHLTSQPRSRLLTLEPLEDRRLLAAAPLNFTVANTGGPGLELAWVDNPAATQGYEIQSSVSGLNDAANPILWKTGLWRTATTVGAGKERVEFDRYRSYYFRIQSLPAESTPLWSPIVFTSAPPEDNVVKVSAAVLPGVEMITLRWPEELKFENSTYTISRKAKDDLTWTELVSGDTGNDWVDFDVEEGKAYEYEVKRSSPSGTGYVYAGLELALEDADSTIESPGTVILVIDETQIDATLSDDVIEEIDRLEQDLIAEGWKVVVIDNVNPNDTIESVRDKIVDKYDDDPTNVKAVFLIGHIPVPMSGLSSPDGHTPARPMPADVFYGDMGDAQGNSIWDVDAGGLLENTVPTDGDGKPVELMVGRVDMRDLPDFQLYDPDMDETELLRRYLDKDHAFRTGQVAVERKARISDRFAFDDSSTGAWQTMSGLFGPAEKPTQDDPGKIDVWKSEDTDWTRRVTLAPGRMCGRPRWTTLSLAI